MNVTLLRHGALPPNPQRRFIGAQDIPLSSLGAGQAYIWALSWAHQPPHAHFSAVVCSDLSRCVDTARIIADACGIPVHADARLREICLGLWQGLTPQEVRMRFPDQYEARGLDLAHFRPPQGESFHDLAQRVLPAFDHWSAHFGASRWLLVGHAGVNRVILARYMALSMAELLRIPQPYACATQLGPTPA